MRKTLFIVLLMSAVVVTNAQKTIRLQSPDGKLEVNIVVDNEIFYSVSHDGDEILYPSNISMELDNEKSFGTSSKIKNIKRNTVDRAITSPFYKKEKNHQMKPT